MTEGAAEDDGGTAGEGGARDFGGQSITITGSERDEPSVTAINAALDRFEERANLEIEFLGDADWEANINTQVSGGNPPDISIFPQPGKLIAFARDGLVVPLAEETNTAVDEYWDASFQTDVELDGVLYGVPVKTDLKSLVWYQPAAFTEAGYEVPQTLEEFTALVDQMAADGGPAPLCVGIESGAATGWPFTDWTEDLVLRQHGPEVYDQWVSHEIPFDDERIVESMQTVVDLWSGDNVFASGGSVAATAFGDNAQPILDGNCWMHRQANFFAGFFPDGTPFADPDDPNAVDAFYFPSDGDENPVLTAGNFAAVFNDDPAVHAVVTYMASAEYAEARQLAQTEALEGSISGYLSAARGQDMSVYQPLEQGFIDILTGTEVARFDGSDLMPNEVGAGSFWTQGVDLVIGDVDAETAAEAIEATWPE